MGSRMKIVGDSEASPQHSKKRPRAIKESRKSTLSEIDGMFASLKQEPAKCSKLGQPSTSVLKTSNGNTTENGNKGAFGESSRPHGKNNRQTAKKQRKKVLQASGLLNLISHKPCSTQAPSKYIGVMLISSGLSPRAYM